LARLNIRKIRREQIIDAANRIIASKGLMACTIEELEKEADVSRGVITYHFRDKDEIVTEALASMLRRFDDEGLPQIREIQDPEEKLRKMVEVGSTLAGRSAEIYHIMHNFLAQIAHREDIRDTVSNHYAKYRQQIAHVIEHGVSGGAFRKAPVEETSAVIMAILMGLAKQHLVNNARDFDLDKCAHAAAEMVLAYLKK